MSENKPKIHSYTGENGNIFYEMTAEDGTAMTLESEAAIEEDELLRLFTELYKAADETGADTISFDSHESQANRLLH